MNRKEIFVCLKQDILELVKLALRNAETPKEHNKIYELLGRIDTSLEDYDEAWRAEVKRVADNVQEEMREE